MSAFTLLKTTQGLLLAAVVVGQGDSCGWGNAMDRVHAEYRRLGRGEAEFLAYDMDHLKKRDKTLRHSLSHLEPKFRIEKEKLWGDEYLEMYDVGGTCYAQVQIRSLRQMLTGCTLASSSLTFLDYFMDEEMKNGWAGKAAKWACHVKGTFRLPACTHNDDWIYSLGKDITPENWSSNVNPVDTSRWM